MGSEVAISPATLAERRLRGHANSARGVEGAEEIAGAAGAGFEGERGAVEGGALAAEGEAGDRPVGEEAGEPGGLERAVHDQAGIALDVAVFLHDYTTRWNELDELCRISNDILVDTGALISPRPFPAGTYKEPRPLMLEIAKDGLDL